MFLSFCCAGYFNHTCNIVPGFATDVQQNDFMFYYSLNSKWISLQIVRVSAITMELVTGKTAIYAFVNQPTLLLVAIGEIAIMLWLLIKGVSNNISAIEKQ